MITSIQFISHQVFITQENSTKCKNETEINSSVKQDLWILYENLDLILES